MTLEEMKKEFEEKFMLGESLDDYDSYFERDADTIRELYSWFESKLKSEIAEACKKAKIEENEMYYNSMTSAYYEDMNKDSEVTNTVWLGIRNLFENRIKELSSPKESEL